ncbi:MAG: hypothetical protein AB8B74_12180 [Crocinitomicaceae bacterium]
MKRLLLVGLLTCANLLNAQTFGNMPFTTPQTSNPAFIVLNDLPKLNVYGKTGRYFNSSYVGYNQYSSKLKGSFGVYYNGFRANDSELNGFNKNNVGISYARLFNINEKWKYSLGAGVEMAASGGFSPGEFQLRLDLGFNVGSVIYNGDFFTSVNAGSSLDGNGRFTIRSGYKLKPFQNKDFSITPIVSINQLGGRTFLEGNLNIAHKKMSLNLGYNYNGLNVGFGYDFKKFRLNYTVGNMFLPDSRRIYHEIGIQFKFNKKSEAARDTKFNHRLF